MLDYENLASSKCTFNWKMYLVAQCMEKLPVFFFFFFFFFPFFFFFGRGFKHFMSNKQRPLPLRYCTFDFADQSYANKSALILFWMDSHTLDSPTSQLAWNQQVATESTEPLEYLNTQHYFIQFISCPHIAHSYVGCKIALSMDNFALKKWQMK